MALVTPKVGSDLFDFKCLSRVFDEDKSCSFKITDSMNSLVERREP